MCFYITFNYLYYITFKIKDMNQSISRIKIWFLWARTGQWYRRVYHLIARFLFYEEYESGIFCWYFLVVRTVLVRFDSICVASLVQISHQSAPVTKVYKSKAKKLVGVQYPIRAFKQQASQQ